MDRHTNRELLFIVWTHHSRRAETLAQEVGGRVSFQYATKLKRRWLRPLRYLVQAWDTWQLLDREHPDVVMVQVPPIFSAVTVSAWCQFRGKSRATGTRTSYIVDCHTGAFYSRDWSWSLPLLRLLGYRAALMLTTDEPSQALFEKWKLRGFFLPDGLPALPPAHGTIGTEGDSRVAVVSTFDAPEPIEEVFRAAEVLPSVTFYVTGDPQRAAPELLAHRPKNVLLTGFLRGGEYTALLENVHGLVVLSKKPNDMSCGAYEAVVIAKPAVVSDWPAMRRHFSRGFVYVQNTPEAIAAGVRQMLDNQDALARQMTGMRMEIEARRRPRFDQLTSALRLSTGASESR